MRRVFAVLLGLGLCVLGCGGGGGGDSGGGLLYVGKTDPALLTRDNAKDFASLAFGGTDTGGILFRGDAGGGSKRRGWALWASLDLAGALGEATAAPEAAGRRAGRIPVDETIPCDSGFMSLKGNLDDDGTGTVAIAYEECRTGDETVDGTGSFEIDALDLGTFTITDATIRFDLLTFTAPGVSESASGSMRLQTDQFDGSETLTLDMVTKDNLTSAMARFENLVFDTTPVSAGYAATVNGRVYDSADGYVDLSTAAPLGYASLDAPFPDRGGPLRILGAGGAALAVTPASESDVRLILDAQGDGLLEYAVRAPWTALEQDTAGTAPVAEAGADRAAGAGAEVELDGTDSYDADGDLLAFSWRLVSRPEGSLAAVQDGGRPLASFTPDLPGVYVVEVEVSGGAQTDTDTTSVSVDAPPL